ncbi:MAG TPA: hypothetical protein VKB53_01280 [Gammaproteobacteria bacterium]|nr:hypothetical protein [Gammaproteobacteria bacterium]
MTDFDYSLPVTLLEALESTAKTLGIFGRVYPSEPRTAPDSKGLSCAVWFERMDPLKGEGGLNKTTVRIEYTARVYKGVLAEPGNVEAIALRAAGKVMKALSLDFTLGGTIRKVDLLGAFGAGLGGIAGYLTQDKTLFRVIDITVPLIVDDVWSQVP